MRKRKNVLSQWSPFTVRHVGFDVPIPIDLCVGRLKGFPAYNPIPTNNFFEQTTHHQYTIEFSNLSKEYCEFTIRKHIGAPNTFSPVQSWAVLVSEMQTKDHFYTSIYGEAKVSGSGRINAAVVVLFAILSGILSLSSSMNCLPVFIVLMIMSIYQLKLAAEARDQLAALIQQELRQLEVDLDRIPRY